MFSWDDIPGNDYVLLIDFIIQTFNIDWVKKANVEKIDNGKIIKVFIDAHYILLKLNNEKSKITLKIDDGRKSELIAKTKDNKLKIYNGYFKNVIRHELLYDKHKAFSDNSQIFPKKETRDRIRNLCEKYGKELYEFPFVYDESQALIVLDHNTPNNTLPIIWASTNNEKENGLIWNPVWERIKRTDKKIK